MAIKWNLPPGDEVLANIVDFLLSGDEREAALSLLGCELEVEPVREWSGEFYWKLRFRGPRAFVDFMADKENELCSAIVSASDSVVSGYKAHLEDIDVVFQINNFDFDADWRKEMATRARMAEAHNQGVWIDPKSQYARVWKTLRFRSASEVKVAEALDRANVMYFPNCVARLTTALGRRNKEPDFLVFYKGKWGMLEVDGDPFHPPERAVEDHARDSLFKKEGVTLVHHFDATQCYKEPDVVVAEFLAMLKAS